MATIAEFSPAYIRLLLHFHSILEPLVRPDAPVTIQAIHDFLDDELIERSDRHPAGYQTTTKGNCMIEIWAKSPQPRMIWVDPRDNTPL
jgi:hypothetical protein